MKWDFFIRFISSSSYCGDNKSKLLVLPYRVCDVPFVEKGVNFIGSHVPRTGFGSSRQCPPRGYQISWSSSAASFCLM